MRLPIYLFIKQSIITLIEQARIERNKAVVSSFIFDELAGMSIDALDTLQSQVTAMGVDAEEFTEQAKDAKLPSSKAQVPIKYD